VTLIGKGQVYFARPDALNGSLLETLKFVNPTGFFAVPRVYEKFEERIKDVIKSSSYLKRRIGKYFITLSQGLYESR
jgi:long-chain-fatty-acid--CoA ligase ACSBG